MAENSMPFQCKECGNAWDQPFALPMEMALVAKQVLRVRCPKCDAGSKRLLINWGRRDG